MTADTYGLCLSCMGAAILLASRVDDRRVSYAGGILLLIVGAVLYGVTRT